ncbi:hypothetical protein [Mesorhizobium marinum]|uniref:hypothetical protein n=1 Tax=Mesorhizobium marinum TaxID=3228790 RepID=UPI003466C365
MADRIKRAMQNGLFFVEDLAGGRPPFPVTEEKIQFTSSCISVACLHEIDGEAELILGRADEVMPAYSLDFDGELETPSRQLKITHVPGEVLLKTAVDQASTRVRIWRSHPDWPGWG